MWDTWAIRITFIYSMHHAYRTDGRASELIYLSTQSRNRREWKRALFMDHCWNWDWLVVNLERSRRADECFWLTCTMLVERNQLGTRISWFQIRDSSCLVHARYLGSSRADPSESGANEWVRLLNTSFIRFQLEFWVSTENLGQTYFWANDSSCSGLDNNEKNKLNLNTCY